MKAPRLNVHGQHVKPHYVPHPGKAEGPAGISTDAARQGGEVSGIVARFSKLESADQTPIALGYINATYGQAVSYVGSPQGLRGLLLIWGGLAAALGFGFGVWDVIRTTRDGLGAFVDPLNILFPFALFLFGAYMVVWTTRLELFRPEDEPTIFDRAHRKVYRVFREMHPGWRGLLKRWPLRAAEYDWDLIDAEHHAVLTTTGSTVTRYHSLVFLVKKSASDPTIIDSYTIGHTLELGEQTVAPLWEHIRRFMEEGGPHLPPGEALAPARPPQGFWQSLAAVGPFGSSYRRWWADNAGFMVLIHLVSPLFVPFFLLWGIFNWLSYKTATRVDWPDEVLRAVGPPMNPSDLPVTVRPTAREPSAPVPESKSQVEAQRPAPAARAYASAREPLVSMRLEHPGGALELGLDGKQGRGAQYFVVDASMAIHRGKLDDRGRATLADVPPGSLTVTFSKCRT